MKVTITAVNRTQRISKKTGKPFTSVGIKTQEHGEMWLSGFANVDNADWEAGTEAEIEVEKKGEYLNFKTPKRDSDSSSDNFGNSAAEIKNLITLKLEPLMERNNAGIQKVEHLIAALGARLDYFISKNSNEEEPEPEDDMPNFGQR